MAVHMVLTRHCRPHAVATAMRLPLGLLAMVCIGCADTRQADRRQADREATVTVLYYGDLAFGPTDEPTYLMSLTLLSGTMDSLAPALARAWEHSADWRVWTYRLRTDVRWHDGTPVTAHDVEFTYDLVQDPRVALITAGTADVTVVDDSTVRISYGPAMKLPDYWLTFLPRHLLANEDPARFREWEYFKRPIGNGPYRVTRLVPGEVLEYEAVPDHPVSRPRIKRVRFTLGTNAVAELQSGNVDVAHPTSSEIRVLQNDPRFRLYRPRPFNPRIIIWNMVPGRIFEDVRVRRAVNMALDRRELFRIFDFPEDAPLVDGVFTERGLMFADQETAIAFDRENARRLLRAAGWADANGDGILDRNGRAFRFTLVCGSGRDDERAAVWLKSQLRLAGIEVEIMAVEPAAARQLLVAGRADAFCYYGEALVRNFRYANVVAEQLGIRDDRLWALMEERNQTLDPAGMTALEQQIAARIREYVPATYFYPLYGGVVAHRRLRGMRTPDIADPVTQMTQLWIEP